MRPGLKIFSAAALATLAAITSPFAQTKSFSFENFDGIDASSGIEVNVSQGDVQSVKVEVTHENDLEHLDLYVENGTLHASTDYSLLDFVLGGGLVGAVFNQNSTIRVFITLPTLQSVNASSGASIGLADFTGGNLNSSASSGASLNLEGLAFEAVSLTASSGAHIDVTGTCISVRGDVSSGASINAGALECVDASASASSGGSLDVFASAQLEANASSGGSISVSGTPEENNVRTSSGGGVHINS